MNEWISINEYLIFTLSESINPWVYSLQFLFKSTNDPRRYERKCDWVFSEHSVHAWTQLIEIKAWFRELSCYLARKWIRSILQLALHYSTVRDLHPHLNQSRSYTVSQRWHSCEMITSESDATNASSFSCGQAVTKLNRASWTVTSTLLNDHSSWASVFFHSEICQWNSRPKWA